VVGYYVLPLLIFCAILVYDKDEITLIIYVSQESNETHVLFWI